jgi:hypothetical protein
MTVADNYDIEKQETNGTTKVFSFNFYTSSKDFVKVILEVDGEQSVVPSTDYTIKLNTVGGNVTFTRAPASGGYIIITRETPREQETSFATSSGFPAKTVEGRFDKLTAMIQEIQDTDNRTPSFPVGTDLNVTLPLPEAGKALIWNEDEDNLENSETTFDEIVSDAISAKNDAVAAKEAAETAQGKAEDAQRGAEAAQGAAEIAQGKAEDAKTSAENTVAGFDDHADSKIGEVNTLVGQAEGYATVAENKANAAAGSANDASGYATAASGYASAASTSASNAAVWAEGTDEEVEDLGGEHSAKEWNSILSSSIGDATLTIQRNSEQLATFTANSSTDTTVNIYVPTTPEEINALPATTTINDLTSSSQQDALNSGITSTGVAQITTNKNNITSISAVIPVQATDQNQLADKSFVNSSIATNTANFIGTFNSVAELEGYSGPVTNNDYAFVVGTDSAGNTTYDRYKYTDATSPASWVFEYTLNNSSFTSNQWAAINSGATTTNIGQIATNQTAIGTLSSLTTTEKTNLVGAINELNSGKVSDVQSDGTSIVTDGVAVIPTASGSTKGVVQLSANLTSISNTIAATASMGNNLAQNIITGVGIYSSSSTYSVGDRVRYGQYYYECITAITTAHTWNASEWTQITIQGQIDNLVTLNTAQRITAKKTFETSSWDGGLAAKRTTTGGSFVMFENSGGVLGAIGLQVNGIPGWVNYNNTSNTVLVRSGSFSNPAVGNASTPVYIDSNGIAQTCSGIATESSVALSSGDSLTLANNTTYSGGEITSFSIAGPATPNSMFDSEIYFSSGATATTITYNSTINWLDGSDSLIASAGVTTFVPAANTRYNLLIWYDGTQYNGIAKVV